MYCSKYYYGIFSQKTEYTTKKMREILGVDPIKMEDSIIEMAYNMIESGKIKKTAKYTGPKSTKM